MSVSLYPYSDGDRTLDRNTYFFSPVEGVAFFGAWKEARTNTRTALGGVSQPPAAATVFQDPGTGETGPMLEYAYFQSNNLGPACPTTPLLEKLLWKFEVTKRLHGGYDNLFRALDKNDFSAWERYVRMAEILENAFDKTRDIRFYNGLLKILDTLCSVTTQLNGNLAKRVCWLLDREQEHFTILRGKIL